MSAYLRDLRSKVGHDHVMLQSVAVLLFDDDRRLLLGQERDWGRWMTIGGAIDPDESPADAAVREVWEETGLHIEPTALVGVFGGPGFRITYPNGDVASYTATVFEARRVGGEARPDGVELTALGYFSQEEAAGLQTSDLTRILLSHAFARDAKPYFAPARWRPPGM